MTKTKQWIERYYIFQTNPCITQIHHGPFLLFSYISHFHFRFSPRKQLPPHFDEGKPCYIEDEETDCDLGRPVDRRCFVEDG